MNSIEIDCCYEDEDLLVVSKPHNLPSQSVEGSFKPNLYDFLKEQHPELYLHHRLDAATAGLILFSKSKRINKSLSEMFKNHEVKRTYQAIVHNYKNLNLEKKFTVENYLKTFKDGKFKKSAPTNNKEKGKHALTHFELLDSNNEYALVQCRPETGRLHQIRVHLKGLFLPVVGDFLYSKRKWNTSLKLHASEISFEHPILKKEILIKSAPEWNLESLSEKG